MLKVSRKTAFAIEAVLDVAYYARPNPVQSRDITGRMGIPERYLEQVMQLLVQRGILKGVRGPKGGYVLARERRKITIGEVVRVIDQLDADGDGGLCSGALLGIHVITPLIEETRAVILDKLDAITVDELCQRAREAAPLADDGLPDYTI